MCFAIPYEIKSINGNIAVVKAGSGSKKIDIHLVGEVKEGDWVLVNQNFAVSKISQKDALKIIRFVNSIKEE
jgi:hydrogenase assembly chaperone HypC/HupF